jgi:hypothetical protein
MLDWTNISARKRYVACLTLQKIYQRSEQSESFDSELHGPVLIPTNFTHYYNQLANERPLLRDLIS